LAATQSLPRRRSRAHPARSRGLPRSWRRARALLPPPASRAGRAHQRSRKDHHNPEALDGTPILEPEAGGSEGRSPSAEPRLAATLRIACPGVAGVRSRSAVHAALGRGRRGHAESPDPGDAMSAWRVELKSWRSDLCRDRTPRARDNLHPHWVNPRAGLHSSDRVMSQERRFGTIAEVGGGLLTGILGSSIFSRKC
jgi:hypothetical protein